MLKISNCIFTEMSIFSLITNDEQIRSQIAICSHWSLWELKSDDILKLDSWPLERTRIITLLERFMPAVLYNIVIEYSGSGYSEILVSLGQSHDLNNYVYKCELRDRSSVHAAQSIMRMLSNAVGMPMPTEYKCALIRDTVSNMKKYDSYPRGIAERKRCAVFHKLLMTYF